MSSQYVIAFGTGIPSLVTGFAPSFIQFRTASSGNTASSPAITEISTTGLYTFSYGPTNAIAFVIDGGSSLPLSSRYISGSLDPAQNIDTQVTNLGNSLSTGISNMGFTLVAIGNSLAVMGASLATAGGIGNTLSGIIGNTSSSFGSTATDPATVFGYLKRMLEFNEGNSTFSKTNGLWDIYSRGSSTQLIEKTLTDTSQTVTKS